eukprot:TRINITY_DN12321_c0_g1_i1.p1 TRINITY_DN12321_c0_g1~~TRINITY_DN12321_c0_g1_i1.p1  ORF type:complete len:233 (-),score=45.85 TRINITY_DN12321_c0_g1_i1:36-734(-)
MSIRSQIQFLEQSDCDKFEQNPFIKIQSKCKHCQAPLLSHKGESVSDEDILIYLKIEAGKYGTHVYQHASGGNMYLGGTGASSPGFIADKEISSVVNCAGGLYDFFPRLGDQVRQMKEEGVITVMELGWSDMAAQKLWRDTPWDQIEEVVEFIEESFSRGENVSVHCAMGKTRSTTVVCCYLMVKEGMNAEEALAYCQEKRPVADPSEAFKRQLREFSQSNTLTQLREHYKQ